MQLARLLRVLLFVVAVLGIVTRAEDEEQEEDADNPEAIMKRMDTDKDGKLTVDEILADPETEASEDDKVKLTKFFVKADANGDGAVNVDELTALIKMFEEDEEL